MYKRLKIGSNYFLNHLKYALIKTQRRSKKLK